MHEWVRFYSGHSCDEAANADASLGAEEGLQWVQVKITPELRDQILSLRVSL